MQAHLGLVFPPIVLTLFLVAVKYTQVVGGCIQQKWNWIEKCICLNSEINHFFITLNLYFIRSVTASASFSQKHIDSKYKAWMEKWCSRWDFWSVSQTIGHHAIKQIHIWNSEWYMGFFVAMQFKVGQTPILLGVWLPSERCQAADLKRFIPVVSVGQLTYQTASYTTLIAGVGNRTDVLHHSNGISFQ